MKTEIKVAILGFAAVIIAALIGIIPNLPSDPEIPEPVVEVVHMVP